MVLGTFGSHTEDSKADLHRHAETYAQLDRLIARLNNQPAHDWESSIERLAAFPPGTPRLTRLNGDLDTVALHALATKYAYFDSWLTAMFEEAAREGAVLVEVRFGAGDGLGPQHMHLFRQAERRVSEKFPHFCAEAIAAIRLSALGETDAFESCLRARDDGLAGSTLYPTRTIPRRIGRGPTRVRKELPKRDWASRSMRGSSRPPTSPQL